MANDHGATEAPETNQQNSGALVDVLSLVTGSYECDVKKYATAVQIVLAQPDRASQIAALTNILAFWNMPASPSAEVIMGHLPGEDPRSNDSYAEEVARFLDSVMGKSRVPDRAEAMGGPEGFDTFVTDALDLLLRITSEAEGKLATDLLVLAQAAFMGIVLEDGSLHRDAPKTTAPDEAADFELIVQNPQMFRTVDALIGAAMPHMNIIGFILDQNLDGATQKAFISLVSKRLSPAPSRMGIARISIIGGMPGFRSLEDLFDF